MKGRKRLRILLAVLVLPPWLFAMVAGLRLLVLFCVTRDAEWWSLPLWVAIGVPVFVGTAAASVGLFTWALDSHEG